MARIAAGSGLGTGKLADEAALDAAITAMAASGAEKADVAFVFTTAEAYPAAHAVLHAVRRVTGARAIVGCSGAGVLTERREVEVEPATAVLVVRVGESPLVGAALIADRERLDEHVATEIVARTGAAVAEGGCLFVLPDAMNLEPRGLLRGIAERLDAVPVVGAVAAGSPLFELYNTDVVRGGLSALALGGARPLIGVAQGCQPIGEPYVVTAVDANVVLSIAGRPPVEILTEAIRSVPDFERRLRHAGVFAGLAMNPAKSPLGRGDFLVRNLTGVDQESGAIAIAEPVRVGQTIQFQIRDGEAARDDLEAMLARIAVALGDRQPAFGVYFNCAGRGQGLYGVPDHDVTLIRHRLGEWPLVGFFGNGEFAPVGVTNFFHTYTGVLAVFPQP